MLAARPLGGIAASGLFIRAKEEHDKPVKFGHTGSSGTSVWLDLRTDTIGIMLTQTRGSDIRPFQVELERRIMAAVSRLK